MYQCSEGEGGGGSVQTERAWCEGPDSVRSAPIGANGALMNGGHVDLDPALA